MINQKILIGLDISTSSTGVAVLSVSSKNTTSHVITTSKLTNKETMVNDIINTVKKVNDYYTNTDVIVILENYTKSILKNDRVGIAYTISTMCAHIKHELSRLNIKVVEALPFSWRKPFGLYTKCESSNKKDYQHTRDVYYVAHNILKQQSTACVQRNINRLGLDIFKSLSLSDDEAEAILIAKSYQLVKFKDSELQARWYKVYYVTVDEVASMKKTNPYQKAKVWNGK